MYTIHQTFFQGEPLQWNRFFPEPSASEVIYVSGAVISKVHILTMLPASNSVYVSLPRCRFMVLNNRRRVESRYSFNYRTPVNVMALLILCAVATPLPPRVTLAASSKRPWLQKVLGALGKGSRRRGPWGRIHPLIPSCKPPLLLSSKRPQILNLSECDDHPQSHF